MEKPKKSIAHERRVECYLPPKYDVLVKGFREVNEFNKSEAIVEIVKSYFDNIPEKQRVRCLNEGLRVTSSKHSY